MQLINVESSNISAIGFQEGKQLSLNSKPVSVMRIQFKSGKSYDYYDVKKETYNMFLKTESKGKFFHSNINNKYQFELVK